MSVLLHLLLSLILYLLLHQLVTRFVDNRLLVVEDASEDRLLYYYGSDRRYLFRSRCLLRNLFRKRICFWCTHV